MTDPSLLTAGVGPCRTLETTVREEWLDLNGHMNSRRYGLVIYDAHAAFTELIGLGEDYMARTQFGKVVVESHILYEKELRLGEMFAVDSWLLGIDDKRAHFFHELRSLETGGRVAAGEQLDLHFDLTTRRVAPFPADLAAGLRELSATQCSAGLPTGTGRTPGIRG